MVASSLERGPLWSREECRLRARVHGVALACSRIGDRLRKGHAEVDAIEQDLQHGGDDRRAARRAEREKRSPALATIVGAIELRGRLPPSTRLGWVAESKLKSVSSLLSRNPKPGTTRPEPPVDSIVNVYETTFPDVSEVVRCVVVSAPS